MYWTNHIIDLPIWSLHDLQPFIFDNHKKEHILKVNVEVLQETKDETQIHPSIEEETYEPPIKPPPLLKNLFNMKNCQDPLFWCLYIYNHGHKEFQRIGKNNGNEEMKEKQFITDNLLGQDVKTISCTLDTKITKVGAKRIAEDILTQPRTKLSTLCAFALYYNVAIFLVDTNKKTYICYENTNTTNKVVLYKDPDYKKNSYYIDTEEEYYTVDDIKTQYIELLSHDKPLRAISNYKASELEDIAVKLGIEVEVKPKKTELYNKLALYCVWEV